MNISLLLWISISYWFRFYLFQISILTGVFCFSIAPIKRSPPISIIKTFVFITSPSHILTFIYLCWYYNNNDGNNNNRNYNNNDNDNILNLKWLLYIPRSVHGAYWSPVLQIWDSGIAETQQDIGPPGRLPHPTPPQDPHSLAQHAVFSLFPPESPLYWAQVPIHVYFRDGQNGSMTINNMICRNFGRNTGNTC